MDPNNSQGEVERPQARVTLVQIALRMGARPTRLAAGGSYPFVQGDLGEGPGALVQVQAELLQAQLLLQEVAQVPLQEVPTGPLLDGLRKRPRHDEGWQRGPRGLQAATPALGPRFRLQAAAAAPRVPARVPGPRRGLCPGQPLHARSAPGVPQGDPIVRAARLALGLAGTRHGGVPVAPGPGRECGASARTLVVTERGCKRTRGEAAGPEAGTEADSSTAAARRICCHPRGALPVLGRSRRVRDTHSRGARPGAGGSDATLGLRRRGEGP